MLKLSGWILSIGDDELLGKYNDIWNKVNNRTKKEFDSKHICNKTFLKTKTKFYSYETTDFHDKEMSKAGSNYTCLAVMLTDFVPKKMLQVFLK